MEHAHPHRQCTQDLQAEAEVQAEYPPEVILQEIPAEVHLEATDPQGLPIGLHPVVTTLQARREAQAVTPQAGVQVHILPAVLAVAAATQEADSPAADHREVQVVRTAEAAPEAAAEEDNH